MTGAEIADFCRADVENMLVPEWGKTVRVKKPDLDGIFLLLSEFPDQKAKQIAVINAYCVDLNTEQIKAMAAGDGLRFVQLSKAINARFAGEMEKAAGKPTAA